MAAASTSNGSGSGSTAAPSPTLYVKNIEGKVKKLELRRQLHSLFSTYGRVLDVVSTRAPSMRGQAFIVFENPTFSSAAKRGLTNFSFYGKPLHIEYSTGSKSKALLRRELGEEAVLEMQLEESKTTVSRRGEKRSLVLTSQSDAEAETESDDGGEADAEGGASRLKRAKIEPKVEDEEASAAGVTIKATNIPSNIEPEVISALFSRQSGYLTTTESHSTTKAPTAKDKDITTWSASIRFDTKQNAEAAKNALAGVQIDPTFSLHLVVL
ncbi:related to U2 small nuclear ribonucleoprotein B [Ustilago trichophora]|uniref:Related to U2 small nuclear ribonucleoprotein B n=1 Tax=Ustilago trichophora TaxID=86804 RepID=A0A5C3EHG8_9BASI|nr:related to U2 small nuclear ribonucleoprotein B [Ustilago trichophora]